VPKEGDPWEEDYLNKTRPPLVPTRGFREALRSLLEALVMFAESSQAATLQVRIYILCVKERECVRAATLQVRLCIVCVYVCVCACV